MVTNFMRKKFKRGIAMIELIFALVIMGIVLMSAPMLIHQSIKSGNVALQQEAIAAAASHTSMLLSLHWDENNTKYNAGISPILGTNTKMTNPLSGLTANLRGRSTRDANSTIITAVPTIKENSFEGTENVNNTFDDVDDYNKQSVRLVVYNDENAEAELGDYVDVNLEINTTVNYADDTIDLTTSTPNVANTLMTEVPNSTNIKFITVNLTSASGVDELNKNITMQAFSCNIGTTTPNDGGEL